MAELIEPLSSELARRSPAEVQATEAWGRQPVHPPAGAPPCENGPGIPSRFSRPARRNRLPWHRPDATMDSAMFQGRGVCLHCRPFGGSGCMIGASCGCFWALFRWIVAPVLAVIAVVYAGHAIGPAWSAAHGGGRHGRFVATEQSCDHGRYATTCGFYGTYASDDGGLRFNRVWLDEPPSGMKVGDSSEVTYISSSSPRVVFRTQGSHEWLFVAVILAAGIVTVAVWGYALWNQLRTRPQVHRNRRRPRSSQRKRRRSRRSGVPVKSRRRPARASRRRAAG